MCRGKNFCSELDENPIKWDIYCPLRQPHWMDEQIDIFVDGINEFILGNTEGCLKKIMSIKNTEIQMWYIEHGQMSGWHRNNILKIQPPKDWETEDRDILRAPKKYQNDVFLRDGYKCRYCGCRLIAQKFLQNFSKKLNSTSFKRGTTNLDTHGIIHLMWPVADHVVPWNLGGRTNPDNLVACCATCNYGKAGYTIEQLGLESPLKRNPTQDEWDGFLSKIKIL